MDRPNVGRATILRGDALHLALADNTVDLVVTSPPYFGLRSYQDGGEHYSGQIGDEATPAEFVDALVAATAEMVRVLKPSGSIWVNLGDKYAQATERSRNGEGARRDPGNVSSSYLGQTVTLGSRDNGVRQKSLVGIPWRYALRCIDDLGLILRAEVIWSKPNGLPESVTDRVRRSHEQWFHFTLNPRYYSAVDAIREAHEHGGNGSTKAERLAAGQSVRGLMHNGAMGSDNRMEGNTLGKIPSSVWTTSPDDGESLTRTVLFAVSNGRITVEEGERILWSASSNSWSASQSSSQDAGNGSSTETHADMPRSASAEGASNSSTASPTSCTSAPSPTASPSTTCAATRAASDPTTSSPSPSARTSDEPTPSASPADTDTPWMTPTSTSPRQASTTRSAGPAHSPASDVGESVWRVPTQPLRVPPELGIDHFAAFPLEFPRRIIRGWSPAGVCTACGEGRRPVSVRDDIDPRYLASNKRGDGRGNVEVRGVSQSSILRTGLQAGQSPATRITGYACACPDTTAPTTPGVVLDPFGGTGTTALLAKALGRHGISNDMSADYCRLATWRTTDEGELARAMQVDKPREQVHGQTSLLDLFDTDEATA